MGYSYNNNAVNRLTLNQALRVVKGAAGGNSGVLSINLAGFYTLALVFSNANALLHKRCSNGKPPSLL
jgi:hypothetical protein